MIVGGGWTTSPSADVDLVFFLSPFAADFLDFFGVGSGGVLRRWIIDSGG